jgi:methyl-accepting chemotaxis protein
MNLSIRHKVLGSFSIILVLVVFAGGFSIFASNMIQKQAFLMREAAALNEGVVKKLKLSNLQVQHSLTKYILTGDMESLKKADEWAEKFRTYLNEMPQKCETCHERTMNGGSSEIVDSMKTIDRMGRNFDAYYEKGRNMTVEPGQVNSQRKDLLISQFDSAVQTISQDLDANSALLGNHYNKSLEDLNNSINLTTNATLWGTLLVLVLGVAISAIMSGKIQKPIAEVLESANNIANGDLSSADLEVRSNDEMGDLTEALNKMRSSLNSILSSISTTSDRMASSSEETSTTVVQIQKDLDSQASRAEQAATSTREMSQTVIDIAKNASNIAEAAINTRDIANEGAEVVNSTVAEVQEIANTVAESSRFMTSLGDRSNQIGEIVNVINDIADQTNLLALNAAIEAARAGEQGRGFAVVADEVRKLAERTGRATTEISDMIHAIQDETGKAVQSMEESIERVKKGADYSGQAGDALNRILKSVNELQSMVQQIASATEQMSTTAEMISTDIDAIASASDNTSKSSSDITEATGILAMLSSDLKSLVGKFSIR